MTDFHRRGRMFAPDGVFTGGAASDKEFAAMPGAPVNSIALTLAFAAGLLAQPAPVPADAESATESLRQIAGALTEAVKIYYADASGALAGLNRGYRSGSGGFVPSADADLAKGPADVMWPSVRKLTVFRLLAMRGEAGRDSGPGSAVVGDLDRIQDLIAEARRRVDASTVVLRRLLVIRAADLDGRKEIVARARRRHRAFLAARQAAETAAIRALAVLPLDQPESGWPEESARKAWDRLGRKPLPANAPALPLAIEPQRRVTIVRDNLYRIAITDSGIEDERGRRIFYEEEWTQRTNSAMRYRWRVAVEKGGGQHILLRRYPPLELPGTLDDVYDRTGFDSVWALEPPPGSNEPQGGEVEAALAEVARAGQAIQAAVADFRFGIRADLERQDRLQREGEQPVLDSFLPERLRQALFAIRGHMARVASVLEAEDNVWRAIDQAERSIHNLEPLAAWANRAEWPAARDPRGASPLTGWAGLLDRSERAIDRVRTLESKALDALPPDMTGAAETFPALAANTIVRIRASGGARDGVVGCVEEVWRLETAAPGIREVRRIVSLIQIDPRTGVQTRERSGAVTYRISGDDVLESVFDQYAADEVSLGG